MSRQSGVNVVDFQDLLISLCRDLPQTADTQASLLRKTRVTHLLTLTPHQPISMSESTPVVERCHLDLGDGLSDELVLKLPEAVRFISSGLNQSAKSVVLIHSFDLTRICSAACAYCKPKDHRWPVLNSDLGSL